MHQPNEQSNEVIIQTKLDLTLLLRALNSYFLETSSLL
jgi:hypothetical protein